MNSHDHASSGDQHARRGVSRRFPSPPSAHPVLRLQRQAGNRAVSSRLGPPIPVQRDLGDEMRKLGLTGSDEDIAQTLAQLIGRAGLDTNVGGKAKSLFGGAGGTQATVNTASATLAGTGAGRAGRLRSGQIDLSSLTPKEKRARIAALEGQLAVTGQESSSDDKTIESLYEKIRAKQALDAKKRQLAALKDKLAGKAEPSEEDKLDEELTALKAKEALEAKGKEIAALQAKLGDRSGPTEEERVDEELTTMKKKVAAKAQQDKIAQSSKELLTTLRNAEKAGGSAALAGIPGGSMWLNMKKRTPDQAGSKSMIAERVTGGSALMSLWRQARKQVG
jgi:hypothetical protein